MLHSRRLRRSALAVLGLTIIISAGVPAEPARSTQDDARSFFKSLVGDWVGKCEQSTDGEPAENKYFHATVKQQDDNNYVSRFEYFRADPQTGQPSNAGETTFTVTICPDGSATSKIQGRGTVLVYDNPKNQQHDLQETLTSVGGGRFQGDGTGTIKVEGMPFGLGSKGTIREAKSCWYLQDGVMKVDQTLKAEFKALIFKKRFSVEAHYTARRGSDVAALIKSEPTVAGKPSSPPAGS